MKKERKKQIIALFILFFFFGSSTFAIVAFLPVPDNTTPQIPAGVGSIGSTHEHADFKVYINGNTIDFSQQKYQVASPYIHVEDGNGNLIHVHATGETIGFFFDTLGMKFNSTCFVLDTGEEFCNQDDRTLKFYVNDFTNNDFEKYLLKDLDQILISYGNETEEQIQSQLDSITDDAYFEGRRGSILR